MLKRNKSAFTLIEILVVITIISILSSAGFSTYQNASKSARDAKRRADLHAIQVALQSYYAENGSYPIQASWTGAPSNYGSNSTNYIPGMVPSYIDKLPVDPKNGQAVSPCNNATLTGYIYRSTGTDYKLMAYCSPEGTKNIPTDPFYDPVRPTYSWQISSPGGVNW